MSEQDRPLDLRTANKIGVDFSKICPRETDCPISKLHSRLRTVNDFQQAKGIGDSWPEITLGYEDQERVLFDCQVEIIDGVLPCGTLEVEESILKRDPKLLFQARRVITVDGKLGENPFFNDNK